MLSVFKMTGGFLIISPAVPDKVLDQACSDDNVINKVRDQSVVLSKDPEAFL